MRSKWRLLGSLLTFTLLASCSPDATAPLSPEIPPFLAGGGSGSCDDTGRFDQKFNPPAWFDCGAVVDVLVATANPTAQASQQYLSIVNTAISNWNSLFGSQTGLPKFGNAIASTAAPTTGQIKIIFDLQNAGSYWCGSAPGETATISRTTEGTGCGHAGTSTQDVSALVTHEIGHPVGFKHTTATPTESCIMHVGADGSINSSPCEHEEQLVFWVYGFRDVKPTVTEDLIIGVQLLPAVSQLSNGQTETFLAQFATTSGGALPAIVSGDLPVLFSMSGGATAPLDWSIANTSIVSFSTPPSPADTSVTVQASATNTGTTTLSAALQPAANVVWPYPSTAAAITVSQGTDTSPPTAPTGVTASAVSHSQVNVSWNPASDPQSGIASYKVRRNGAVIATVSGVITSYSDQTVNASTTYTYKAQAVNGADLTGPLSSGATVTTPAAPFVQTVVITPAPVTLTQSQPTKTVTAVAKDASGNVIPGVTFNWTVFNTNVATILGSSQGVSSVIVEGENSGSTKLQATPTIPGKRKRVNVNVNCGGPCF